MKILSGIYDLTGSVYSYGILSALFIGGLSFFAYIAALITGGEDAAAICTFIYKTLYPELVYWTSWIVLLGIIRSYTKRFIKN